MSDAIREYVDDLLRELGKHAGVAGFGLNEKDAFTLRLDGAEYALQWHKTREELYFIHGLGALPAETAEKATASAFLLEKNCFFRGVGSGVLGVQEGQIWYCARLCPEGVTYQEFERFILAAADFCAALRQEMPVAAQAAQENQTGQRDKDMDRLGGEGTAIRV